jgi:hypothetical protein
MVLRQFDVRGEHISGDDTETIIREGAGVAAWFVIDSRGESFTSMPESMSRGCGCGCRFDSYPASQARMNVSVLSRP